MKNAPSKKRILVAEESPVLLARLVNLLQDEGYEVLTAWDGAEVLKAVALRQPDLVILDLTLPLVHGIDVLKKIKEAPTTQHIGVIVSTARALYQDYQSAMESGADYYLIKPFQEHDLLHLLQSYFAGHLKAAPFAPHGQDSHLYQVPHYSPFFPTPRSYLKLWGTRGSIPVSGPEYLIYGGNTSCLEIRSSETLVIIDSGTGIRPLGRELLLGSQRHIHLFIGHTHWDHILGFPFFAPVYDDTFHITIYAAKGFGRGIQELFSEMLTHDYFPVKLDEMKASLSFVELQGDKPVCIEDLVISYCYASHPGATLAFKIQTPKQTIGYITDNEMLVGYHGHPNEIDRDHPLLAPYQHMIDFFSNCDLLIHEAQYTPEEYLHHVGWGHSSISNAAVLVKHTQASQWVVTHHDPSHTDQFLRDKLLLHQSILQDCHTHAHVMFAYDGIVFPLGS